MIPTFSLGSFGLKNQIPFDPYAADVVLFMRMEGSNGGTFFTDSGPLALPIINTGRTTSTDYAKSGNTSLKENNSGGTSVAGTAATELSGVFTVEAWVFWTTDPTGASAIWNLLRSGGYGFCCSRYSYPQQEQKIYADFGASGVITGTTVITNNAWHHIRVTRDGSNVCRLWVDGVQEGATVTDSNTWFYNHAGSCCVASADGAGVWNLGNTSATYMDLFRVTKALRNTGPFTPPADMPAQPSATLLLRLQGADESTTFTDSSSLARTITPVGNAKIDTAHIWSGISSAYFDGSASWLQSNEDASALMPGDFTMEVVAYWASGSLPSSTGASHGLLEVGGKADGVNKVGIIVNTSNKAQMYLSPGSQPITSTDSVTADTWHHFCLERIGSTCTLYLNGVAQGTTESTTTFGEAGVGSLTIVGAIMGGGMSMYLKAWVGGVRINRGVALYGASPFTPPTSF